MKKFLFCVAVLAFLQPSFDIVSAQDTDVDNDSVYARADIQPAFPGGETALFKFIGENIVYPQPAYEQKIQGKAYCEFIVEKDGSLTNIHIVYSSRDSLLDAEALRIVHSMPRWLPGSVNGETVRAKSVVPVIFRIKEDSQPPLTDNSSDTTDVVKMPEFVGGQKAMFDFLSNQIRYPKEAMDARAEGRTVCVFMVNADGTISDVMVEKSSGNRSLDAEALRVVRLMPKWIPGTKNGQPVSLRYGVPVNFSMKENNYKRTNAQKVLQNYLDSHFNYEPFKSGANDVYSLEITIPLSVTVDSLGRMSHIELTDKINSRYNYVIGRETYKEKEGVRMETISKTTFSDNNTVIASVNAYCNNLEAALIRFIKSLDEKEELQCKPSRVHNKPITETIRITLSRDGLKVYHTK